MKYNRKLTISTAGSRKSVNWPASSVLWSEFCDRLKTPVRSTETYEVYLLLKKAQQDDLKDVGGFVGGTFNGQRRKASEVAGRDLITLDMDNIPVNGTIDVLKRVQGLGCAAVVYSTRKHSPATPRLRVIVPLDQTATADEYEPIARRLAAIIGMQFCDPTTFEASRLMYWPSVSQDGEFVYQAYDNPFLSKAGMLGLYKDWRDVAEWPQVPGVEAVSKQTLAHQQDPLTKKGVVGTFCRAYNIPQAMEKFIPDVYEETDMPGRYTYRGGSTTGGAVLYQDDTFLYSHHATDPCSGQLVNAWDMVRLHKFGHMDAAASPGAKANALPSYKAMQEMALQDMAVRTMINAERFNNVSEAFKDAPEIPQVEITEDTNTLSWMQSLEVDPSGKFTKTVDNVILVLENDERLKDRLATDVFAGVGIVLGTLPWSREAENKRRWVDADDSGIRWYMEKHYGIPSRDKIDDALSIIGHRKQINVVKEYLQGLKWDGEERLDTLFIDYLGAEDTEYVRAATRKVFTAAVARAILDGVKFDYMPIIIGKQGIGKSTMLSMLGKDWFSDSLTSFEGKDAAEMIQGTWINEIGELTAMSYSETNSVKQFLSKTHDIYRAAYGRRTQEYPRRCVFIGTSNNTEILRDRTGNRRFWPIDTEVIPKKKNVWEDLPKEVDQIWAEAYVRFMLGEKLYLPPEIEKAAREQQEKHEDADDLKGIVEMFLEQEIPEDWDAMSLATRKMFFSDGLADVDHSVKLRKRTKVCAREIYFECLNRLGKDTDRRVIKRINDIMKTMPKWKYAGYPAYFGPYGSQRGFYYESDPFDPEDVR